MTDDITVQHNFNCATCGYAESLTELELETAELSVAEMHDVKCDRCSIGYMTHSNTVVRYTDSTIRDRSTTKTLLSKARNAEYGAFIDVSGVAVITRDAAHELKNGGVRVKMSDAVRRTMKGVR